MLSRYGKPAAVVLALGILGIAHATGLLDFVQDVEAVRVFLAEGGLPAIAAYIACFVVLSGLGVPTIVFMVPTRAIWPAPIAVAVSFIGGMGGSLIGFLLARYVARDWVAARLPPKLRAMDEAIERHPMRTVVGIRLTLFLIPPTNWFLGLSKVPLRTFLLGTLLGAAPGILLFSLAGGPFFAWVAGQPAWVWALFVSAVVSVIVFRRVRARGAEAE